uniref:ATP-binding cassette sub-family C member 8-like n=1 Tax=Saccoglossus kowalevskii TaxID=10224 RepID=A0ABM0MJR2_SACKO|nr:PREDICTED: ATP-binding cassette sub-family C member 8-like [Saccoglossus kowalevskii]
MVIVFDQALYARDFRSWCALWKDTATQILNLKYVFSIGKPLLTQCLKAVAKPALDAGLGILGDVVQVENFKKAASRRAKTRQASSCKADDSRSCIIDYYTLFTDTNTIGQLQDQGNGNTRDEYLKGYTIFAFNLTLDESVSNYHLNLIQEDLMNSTSICCDTQVHVQQLRIVLHILFIIIASGILIVMRHFTELRYYDYKFLLRYPGHAFKWSISGILIVVSFFSVAEGILTDLSRNDVTNPYLYIPQMLSLLGLMISLMYYHHMEYWDRPHLVWLLLLYWIMAIIGEVLAIFRVSQSIGFNYSILRLDIGIITTILYSCCAAVEINVLHKKIVCPFSEEKRFPKDFVKTNLYYMQSYVNILSNATIWWLNWLVSLSRRQTIVLDDLGCLPGEFEGKRMIEAFNKVYRYEQNLVYEKSLRLPQQSADDTTVGKTINHMSVDVTVIQHFVTLFLGFVLSNPIQISIVLIWLLHLMGIAGVVGICVGLLIMPLALKAGRMQHKLQHLKMMFAVYSRLNTEPLTPDVVFTALALTNLLIQPLSVMPPFAKYAIEVVTATKRLAHFLSVEEIERYAEHRSIADGCMDSGCLHELSEEYEMNTIEMKPTTPLVQRVQQHNYQTTHEINQLPTTATAGHIATDVAIEIVNGYFSWGRRTLTIVVGKIGTGKSSLVSAILGEMNTISGSVTFNGRDNRIAYVAQKAWLQNASLRDNILFGETYVRERYNTVLQVCALNADLRSFPGGDMTEIGERGINVSGGQKHRICLARALYSNTDVVILDDPLSALDVHVSAHVMENAILGYLREQQRTVILVTHKIQYLEHANQVLVMENGQIIKKGNLCEIRRHNIEMYRQWEELISTISEYENENELVTKRDQDLYSEDLKASKHPTLVEDESSPVGVGWYMVYLYLRALKLPRVGVLVLVILLKIVTYVFLNMWISNWSQAGQDSLNKTKVEQEMVVTYYLPRCSIVICLYIMMNAITNACLFIFCISAAKRLFNQLLYNVIYSPIRFFETTPVGRLLNRFSADVRSVDQSFWECLHILLGAITVLAGTYVVNAIISPYSILLMIPVGVISVVYIIICSRLPRSGTNLLNLILIFIIDSLSYFNGIERVLEYASMVPEKLEGTVSPPNNWPSRGSINIHNITARYAISLDPVLSNVSVKIIPGEKVGICGRTGSGKSSLTLTLLRMIDIIEGRIVIDGIDISTIPVLTLRRRMSIIPQDPVLFCGTLRFNLDPEEKYGDQDLWNALEIAQLKDCVLEMNEQLDTIVTDGGDNISTGQRQLICLARAFLRKSRILIMDEATASVDLETDATLQAVIATAFSDKTVLTIAHRISTILDSDTVLVLSEGRVVEYGTPQKLLRKDGGMFASLVNNTE